MKRSGALVLLVAAVLAMLAPAAAQSQGYRTLHVDALSMRADRERVRVGEVFHLAIHVHVRENITALDELIVPDVGTLQLEGNERHVTHAASGTDVVETLTLEAAAGGTYHFAPAYLDAIDGRTRKPSRFSSNPVVVVVDAPAELPSVRVVTVGLLELLVIVFALAAAVVVLVAVVRARRKRAVAPVPQPVVVAAPVPPPPPPRTPRDDVADALRVYRNAPANGSLEQLRARLYVVAGARPGATLRDALAETSDDLLRVALIAAERTAFGPAHVRDTSSAELIDATEAWLR